MDEGSRNHCCSGKAISITYSDYVFVALGIHNAKRMSRIVFSCVSCPTLQYFFPNYLTNGMIFRKNIIELKMCVFGFLYNIWFETFLILRRIQRNVFTNVHISVFM